MPTDDIDRATRLALYRSLTEIRVLEKRAYDRFLQNLVKGTSHLSMGQEAFAAGFAVAMRKDDYTFCTYRGHAHTLARGAPMVGVLGELMGRSCGLMHGKGGSMHLTSVEHGAMGSYAIVGANLPVAAGAAWSAQLRGTGQVAVCFFGGGASCRGPSALLRARSGDHRRKRRRRRVPRGARFHHQGAPRRRTFADRGQDLQA